MKQLFSLRLMMFSRRSSDISFLLLLILAITFFSWSTTAIANQQVAAMDYGIYDLSLEDLMSMEVITASRHAEPLRKAPSAMMVITADQIHNRHYRNLIDVLQDLPGVQVFRQTESTRYHNVSWRGHLGNNKFLILQDGVRIDSPTGEIIPIANNFPIDHAQRIEVMFGPASAMYGADAFAGVINIISLNPEEIDGLHLSYEGGSFAYNRQSVQIGKQINEWLGFTASVNRQTSDTANLPTYYPNSYPAASASTFAGAVVVPAANREAFSAAVQSHSSFLKLKINDMFELAYQRSFFRNPSSTGEQWGKSLFTPSTVWNTDLQHIYGKVHLSNDKFTVDSTLHYATYEADPTSKFVNVFTNFIDGYKYAYGRKLELDTQLLWQANQQHSVLTGITVGSFYSIPKTADLPSAYNTSQSVNNQGLFYANTNNNLPLTIFDKKYTNNAAFLQLSSDWSDSISTTIGVRYDNNSRYDASINPRLGLVYLQSATTSWKLLYGEAYRAPAVVDSFAIFGGFDGKKDAQGRYTGGFFRAPNPNLQPEKTRNIELSFDHRIADDFNMGLNVYYITVNDIIMTRTEAVATQYIPGAVLATTQINDNLGTSKQYGIDLRLQSHWRHDSWRLDSWAYYSALRGQIRSGNGQNIDLPYITNQQIKLGTTFNWQEKIFISPILHLVAKTNTNRVSPTNPTKRIQTPGYALLDLHAGINEVFTGTNMIFDIHNTLNRRYFNAGGIASTSLANMPQQPRSFVVSLEYNY
ncbi:MAG: TonB-dependent receptor [Mariprofundales bacterium]